MRRAAACLLLSLPLAAEHLPVSFEPNRGQADASVKFLARVPGYTLFVTSGEAVFAGRDGSVERMRWIGANPKPRVEPLDKLPGISNYFVGNDAARWRTNIPTYGTFALREVYPGIDLVFHSRQGQLEYDWIVAPGADPKKIRMRWDTAEQISETPSGELILSGSLLQRKPAVSQEGVTIRGGYAIHGTEVSFHIARYDRAKTLVIDPVLVYSTYFGGSTGDTSFPANGDVANAIAIDASGAAYFGGYTSSLDYPTTSSPIDGGYGGGLDGFITKLNAAGSAIVYSTYFGGSKFDSVLGIAVDGSGSAYICGSTRSANFPIAHGLQSKLTAASSGFVAKLNSSGSALVYSTYLGGTGSDAAVAITVDSNGDAYLTGSTSSVDFPTVNAIKSSLGAATQNAFVSELNATGSALIYSTYLGGTGQDAGQAIAIDGAGNAYVAGATASTDFPAVSPIQPHLRGSSNAFVSKINAVGSALLYSTYLGGGGSDSANGIAVDRSGNVMVTGFTSSTDFPLANAIQKNLHGSLNAFVSKVNPSGSALLYSTYLGGSGSDNGNGIAIDSAGNAYVVGLTTSTDFPVVAPIVATNTGKQSGFVTKLDPGGASLVYSTYLGGTTGGFASAIAADARGDVFVTGTTSSSDFPTKNPLQSQNHRNQFAGNAFVSEIAAFPPANCPIGPPSISSVNFATDFGGFPNFSSGAYLEVKGTNLAIDSRQWAGADFQGSNAPTALDSSRVSIDGINGYVSYISGQQINVQAPADSTNGLVPIVVTNCAGSSNTVTLMKNAVSPGMLAPAAFNVGRQYVAALFASDLAQGLVTFAGNTGLIAGANFRPAKPGDVIVMYGLGFGAVTPATAPGVIAAGSTNVAGVSISFGSTPASVSYAGLYPGFVGLYEFYVTVPNVGNGDSPVNISVNGTAVPQSLFLTVHQ